MTAAIEVDGLVKRYRHADRNAVDGISFAVPDGAFVCLLGPNGAGKSTTIGVLTTMLSHTDGRALVAGRDVRTERAAVRREIGVVFQHSSLDLNLTAEENIRLHCALYGLYPWRPAYRLTSADYRRQVGELAGVLGLGDILRHRAGTLSGGLRRRLELVRSLMHRPRVLFLDEPTTGLDPQARRDLWRHIDRIRAEDGTTVLLTTHYLEEAEPADAVYVLIDGRIAESGTPGEVTGRQVRATLEEAYLELLDRSRE
ncbi:ABC transporter ATP-binding protein [Actinoplanes sp. NPDC051411]|uniref:ABC transporter ATP-binding protein n=1 Tax=Actinoplanes sp. NPDC051411 TaxID=3155522 RepID=UPI00342F1B4D